MSNEQARRQSLFRIPSLFEIFFGRLARWIRQIAAWRKQGLLKKALQAKRRTNALRMEQLEPRVLLSADITYGANPADLGVGDVTLVAEESGGNYAIKLYDSLNLSNEVGSYDLEASDLEGGNLEIDVSRFGGDIVNAIAHDRLRIDMDSLAQLDGFINDGGVLKINFKGGAENLLTGGDRMDLESDAISSYSLPFGLHIVSTSDIIAGFGDITVDGDFTLESEDSISLTGSSVTTTNGGDISLLASDSRDDEGAIFEGGEWVGLVHTAITLNNSTLDGDKINIKATSTVDIESDGVDLSTIAVAAFLGDASATIDIFGGSVIIADSDVDIHASSSVTLKVEAIPESSGGDATFDAAVAISTIDSAATTTVANSTITATTGTVKIHSTNDANVTTTADGSAVTSAVGASVAVTEISGDTTTSVTGATITSDLITIEAISTRVSTTKAISTDGGGEDGTGDSTETESEKQLSEQDASTDEGSISFAGAVSVTVVTGNTSAIISGGDLNSDGDINLNAKSTNTLDTVADGSATGEAATGVGVAVGVSVLDVDTVARATGGADLTADNVNILAQMPSSSAKVSATSGASASDVGVAGSLAINVTVTDTNAEVGSLVLNGSNLSATADSKVKSEAKALPSEDGVSGDNVGVGASVVINISDNQTMASVLDGATVSGGVDITLSANADHGMVSEAKGGAAGGTAVSAVVAISVTSNETVAKLGAGGTLTNTGDLKVEAKQVASVDTKAEGDAEGESAAVGAAVAITVANDRVVSTTGRSVDAGGNATFSASGTSSSRSYAKASAAGAEGESEDEDAQAAQEDGDEEKGGVDKKVDSKRGKADQKAASKGAKDTSTSSDSKSASTSQNEGDSESSGTVSVAAAISVNVQDSVVEAYVPTGQSIEADGTVTVSAKNQTDAAAIADGTAVTLEGGTGIGAAVSVNVANVKNLAYVEEGATIEAGGLAVEATM